MGRVEAAEMPAQGVARSAYFWVSVAVLLAAVAATAWIKTPVYPIDDTYITLHNARVLLSGVDRNYPGVSALAGATSAAHLVLVAALLPILGDWSPWVLAWIAVLLLALGIVRIGTLLQLPRWGSPVLLSLMFSSGFTWYQLLNGLETGWGMAAALWLLIFASDERSEKACGLVAGIAPFFRPELAALSALVLGWKSIVLWRKDDRKRVAQLLGFAALGALPWMVLNYSQLGSFVPMTVTAKRAFFAVDGMPEDFRRSEVFKHSNTFFTRVGLVSLGLFGLARSPVGRLSLLFVFVFYYAYYLQLPPALDHYFSRYQFILLPLAVFGFGLALTLKPVRWPVAGLAVLAAALSLAHWKDDIPVYTSSNAFTTGELVGLTQWCQANIPPDEPILIHDAGYIAYVTDFRLIDMVGLKSPEVVGLHQAITSPSRGARRVEVFEILARTHNAHYIIVRDIWERPFGFARELRRRGWTVKPLREGPYTVYRLTAPEQVPNP